MPNLAIKNTIGEYQKSLDGLSYTAYSLQLQCQMVSCGGNCHMINLLCPGSIVWYLYAKIPKNQMFRNGDYVLKRMIPVAASANLVIGSIELDSLILTPSYCKLSIEQTVACTGCDAKPYMVVRA